MNLGKKWQILSVNSSKRAEYYKEDFKMKKLLILMLSAVMTVGIIGGCGKTDSGVSSLSPKENDMESATWTDYKVSVNGTVVALKEQTIGDLEESFGNFDDKFDAGIRSNASAFGNFEGLTGLINYIVFHFYNQSSDALGVEDCEVCGISISRVATEDVDIEVVLPGGFNFETCNITDLVDAYGEAEVSTNHYGDDVYLWSEVKDNCYLSIEVNSDGSLKSIMYRKSDYIKGI